MKQLKHKVAQALGYMDEDDENEVYHLLLIPIEVAGLWLIMSLIASIPV